MTDINIKQIIAHDIDVDKESPKLFDSIFSLTTVPTKIINFFKEHINVSLNAKQIKTCKFYDESTVMQQSSEIHKNLSNPDVFVKITKMMTQSLYNAISSSSSQSSGTIFYIIYDKDEVDYLAILKMDPSSGIQIDKTTLKLTIQENMLPNPGDKLHKCAFIRLVEDFEEITAHLYVLDRQRGQHGISKFFMNTFLQAKEVLNNSITTKRVINKLYEDAQTIAPEVDPLDFHLEVDKNFPNGRHIDIDHVLEELTKPHMETEKQREDYIEGFKESFREEYEEVTFQFEVEKENTTIQYSTENKDIKFEFPIQYLNDIVTIHDSVNEPLTITIDKKMERSYK